MQIPLSWLRDFVEIDIPVELLAEKLTAAGLEVGHLTYVGVPQTRIEGIRMPKSDHLVWDRERLLLGAIREVLPHPNADRLVIARVEIGDGIIEPCVTGAPNLFEYRGTGELPAPLWTAFAAEGAEVWDGHSDEPKRMILKEKPLRGIPNKSMVCSEKELGMSGEHEGVILMHEAPKRADGTPCAPGTPLQDVLGDVLLEIELTPNLARAYSVYGVAREIAALLDKPLQPPSYHVVAEGAPLGDSVTVEIRVPELNPRFTFALLRGATVKPSPEWMQRRLRLVGQRPINNIVDVTNYLTFEIGQPLHAFDYDKLRARNGGNAPHIITRHPEPGETLATLDGVKRTLEPHNILVADTAGALSLGGVIGGADTEISPETTHVLLEAAAWNFINIRRTMTTQKVQTDAGVRFSRGVHPSQAILGVQRGIEMMRETGGGQVAAGILDVYPAPPAPIMLRLPTSEIERLMGMPFAAETAAALLRRGKFIVLVEGNILMVQVPDTRMDISADPVIGQADLIEEIARIHGYDTIPQTIFADAMPRQYPNLDLSTEETARDVLVALGLREQISYRMTTPERERESGLGVGDWGLAGKEVLSAESEREDSAGEDISAEAAVVEAAEPLRYVEIANPSSPDKTVMRRTLLVSLLENARANGRYAARQAVFEIGAVYLPREGVPLPDEPRRLGILMTGARDSADWSGGKTEMMDFYDLKGVVEGLFAGLHLKGIGYARAAHPSYHPGRSAEVRMGAQSLGVFGEVHPRVISNFGFTAPLFAGEFDLDALLSHLDGLFAVKALPTMPPILQDIALVVKAETPAADIERAIRMAGSALVKEVRLFDVYTGDRIPAGMKSLAYRLTYQSDDRTLTDGEVAKVQDKIVKFTEREFGAKLRS